MTPQSKNNHRAIIRIIANTKNSRINYSRRMYAIIRRYTPNGSEGGLNECFAELTGLRTFFKMTYTELAEAIIRDIHSEIGVTCKIKISTVEELEYSQKRSKTVRAFSTYKEMNKLFVGASYVPVEKRKVKIIKKKIQFTVPFLGKVR